METVIRSPQKGVVKKLAHKEGVSYCQRQSGVYIGMNADLVDPGYLQSWYRACAV